jgi:hypothetical protein
VGPKRSETFIREKWWIEKLNANIHQYTKVKVKLLKILIMEALLL